MVVEPSCSRVAQVVQNIWQDSRRPLAIRLIHISTRLEQGKIANHGKGNTESKRKLQVPAFRDDILVDILHW